MKKKLGVLSCSLFLATGALCVTAVLPIPGNDFNQNNSFGVKAGNNYFLTLNSLNKYNGDSLKSISTDINNGAAVKFSYNNASESETGHVVLNNGGTLVNNEPLTAVSYFVPSFTLGNGASLKFRASNDGTNWGSYASIKEKTEDIASNSFALPNMRYVEFKAEGGSVDIKQILFAYTCSETDVTEKDDYECGTSYEDTNINKYIVTKSYNDFSDGLTIYTTYNGGTKTELNSEYYDVVVKNPSGNIIDKSAKLETGTYTTFISRKDRAFADISYNFTVYGFSNDWSSDDTYHWHKCTNDTIVEINDKGEHVWDEGEVTTVPTSSSEGVKTYTCSTCGRTKTESIPKLSNFTFNNDILTAQKIHTDIQANFLNYQNEYYNITSNELNNYKATGKLSNSDPNKVTLTWNHNVPIGKTIKQYSIVTGQREDLSDGYIITGNTSHSLSFYNPYIGTNYFKVIASFTDGTSEESEIKTFLVEDIAPRNLYVGNLPNCRDMGGRTNISGGRIKQGLIYRTSGKSYDNNGTGANDEAKNIVLNQLRLKTEINVADSNKNALTISGTTTHGCYMDYGSTPYSNFARNAERIREVFSILGDTSNYPVFYHCRIGTDRTGICGVMINGLLGVSFNETMQDYLFSNLANIGSQRYMHLSSDPNGDDAAKYIEEILGLPGNTFQEQVIYALLSIGVPAQTLQNIIDTMTEGNKITIPNNITVANGDLLTNNGGTKQTTNEFKDPDIYYAISGSTKSVSYIYKLNETKEISVVAYLGCKDSSSSKKLANGIDLKIDGDSKTICDKTYLLAGFGTTKQASRTGYMMNLLGKYTLSAGSHTITIAGKNSDTFNIGGISLIGGSGNINVISNSVDFYVNKNTTIAGEGGTEEPSGGGGGQQEDPGTQNDPIEYTKSFSRKKFDKGSGESMTVTTEAGTYELFVSCQLSSNDHSNRYFYADKSIGGSDSNETSGKYEGEYRYIVKVDGVDYPMTNTKTYGENGLNSTSDKEYVSFVSSIPLTAGSHTISVTRHTVLGYSLYMDGFKLTKIN